MTLDFPVVVHVNSRADFEERRYKVMKKQMFYLLQRAAVIPCKLVQNQKPLGQEILFPGAQCGAWEWRQLWVKDDINAGNGFEDTKPETHS